VRVSFEQELQAATLAAGEFGVVSHRAAAALWELKGFAPGPIELTVRSSRSVRMDGIRAYRSRSLTSADVVWLKNLRVTTLARTMIDLASVVEKSALTTALDHAISNKRDLIPTLARRLDAEGPGRSGITLLRRLVGERIWKGAKDESPLETHLRVLSEHHGLPPYDQQVSVYDELGFIGRIDFCYAHAKVAIEADGAGTHLGLDPFDRDSLRWARLTALGWRVVRVTPGNIRKHPNLVVRNIVRTLQSALKCRHPGATEPCAECSRYGVVGRPNSDARTLPLFGAIVPPSTIRQVRP
jgi:hypothetical protein